MNKKKKPIKVRKGAAKLPTKIFQDKKRKEADRPKHKEKDNPFT